MDKNRLKFSFVAVVIISIVILIYNAVVPSYTYASFEHAYIAANKNFNSDNYIKLIDLSQEYSSTTFPDNHLFDKKNDNHEDDFWQPVNRKLAYVDKNEEVLIIVSYIFTESNYNTDILTLNTLPSSITDVVESNYNATLPSEYEFILTMHNYVILLEFFPINSKADATDSDHMVLHIQQFFEVFTEYLSSV